MTSPDLEALKTLVAEATALQKQLDDGDGAYPQDYHDVFGKLEAALPALERLLAGQQEPVAWRAWMKAKAGQRWPADQWVYWDEEEPTTIKDDPDYSQFQPLYASPPPARPDELRIPEGWMRDRKRVLELAEHLENAGWQPDSKGDAECVDQGAAMAAEVVRKILLPMLAAAPKPE